MENSDFEPVEQSTKSMIDDLKLLLEKKSSDTAPTQPKSNLTNSEIQESEYFTFMREPLNDSADPSDSKGYNSENLERFFKMENKNFFHNEDGGKKWRVERCPSGQTDRIKKMVISRITDL